MRQWIKGSSVAMSCSIGLKLQMQLESGVAVTVVQASSCSSDSTPSLRTSTCHGCSPHKKDKNNKIIMEKRETLLSSLKFLVIWHGPIYIWLANLIYSSGKGRKKKKTLEDTCQYFATKYAKTKLSINILVKGSTISPLGSSGQMTFHSRHFFPLRCLFYKTV